MPPPVSVYIEAARLFGGVDCVDVAAAEDFYVRIFPNLPPEKKEKILAFVMEHEWPFEADVGAQTHAQMASPLRRILDKFWASSLTNREAGTYFEHLIIAYLRNEPAYQQLYRAVESYSEWAERKKLDRRDDGIDLVAETFDGETHAVQCKLYAPDYRIQKADIDSFFTASGKKPFSRRLIVSTTNHWSDHAEAALIDQQPPVTKIDMTALETSAIDWSRFEPNKGQVTLKAKKSPLPHQKDAHEAVAHRLAKADRGKLIMACGTGKTFTSLKIAEDLAGADGRVLFLVPSLALLSQSLTEWTHESTLPLASFAVCSDSDVGKRRKSTDDVVQTFTHELRYPATTSPARLATESKLRHDKKHMTVVFATYHSIDVIRDAQRKHDLPAFDLIICDEAHRTTGAKFEDQDESHFIKIHNADFIRGAKRLYMTATPRIYGDTAKAIAERDDVILCSMDDDKLYGENLYILTFSEAVKRGLLVDYKVIILTVDQKHIGERIQKLLKDENNQLRMEDAGKIVGCWKALSKQGLAGQLNGDANPMKRAVAFCQVIEAKPNAKSHKIASKQIAEMFGDVVAAYKESAPEEEAAATLICEAAHVDGSMNATEKDEKISWLKSETPEDTCRILCNVRCLSEGVDVPALDAVLFLTPRNSQIDVVQSVGRVMRRSPGKTRGYIVLPVVIPSNMEPHEALNNNEVYRVVWQVLQALRSHDDRFDAMVNKLDLTGADPSKIEVIAITDKLSKPRRAAIGADGKRRSGRGESRAIGGTSKPISVTDVQRTFEFEFGEIERAIYAKLVQKVGNRHHWEDWARDIAKIARAHIDRITGIIESPRNARERQAFEDFVEELRDDLNDSITDAEVVEMLAQHLVTKPVFDALFSGHRFATENSISRAMQGVLSALEEHNLGKEADTLQAFYDSVKLRAEGIESAAGKQKIVLELYNKFFSNAFPQMRERLGIVYTPVEIVDFILHSVDHLLRTEFGQDLGSPNVHIIDPFTGTGTFITRLIESGLISAAALPRKYATEIHANEIVLLAYYIAAINVEVAYHSIVGDTYKPFEGICLTDTFQLSEKDDLVSRVLAENSARRTRQKALDIRVVVGNPPYSVGQDSENDNNANVSYPLLDARIAATYSARSNAKLAKGLYDSYVRAIRWASDRIGERGIIGFVTNANFIEANTADGMRRCLVDEFSDLYVLHLRGNARTSGERRRKEAGNVFGLGSRAPIAISLLVKGAKKGKRGNIHFHDIGDYLSGEQKLAAVAGFCSVKGIAEGRGWSTIEPDAHGDWLRQRDESFARHMPFGVKDKGDSSARVFGLFSLGVLTARDAWASSPSKKAVSSNMRKMIDAYTSELARFNRSYKTLDKAARAAKVESTIDTDPKKIAWSSNLKDELARNTTLEFHSQSVVPCLYRPFTKQWTYFDRKLNERVYRMPRLFPFAGAANRVIGVSASESRSGYSVLMSDVLPSYHATDMVGSQYFPLYVYEEPPETEEPRSSRSRPVEPAWQDGITDEALTHFQAAYSKDKITKEDVFYYMYGLLHSPDYRERYADNLGKELPRAVRVKAAKDFWAFSRAGRTLGDLHVKYEEVPEFGAEIDGPKHPTPAQCRVEKMRFGRDGGAKDKSVIQYNAHLTVRGIPLEAYDYVVSGKPAIEWVMDRQTVTEDKDSGIVKDFNEWAIETMGDPRYPLSLLLRVVTVSLETMKIVRALPPLEPFD
jgi:predicted helicase